MRLLDGKQARVALITGVGGAIGGIAATLVFKPIHLEDLAKAMAMVLVAVLLTFPLHYSLLHKQNRPVPRNTGRDLHAEFAPMLSAAGLTDIRVRANDDPESPEVVVSGWEVSLSDRVLESVSPAAILWAIRCSREVTRRTRALVVIALLPIALLSAVSLMKDYVPVPRWTQAVAILSLIASILLIRYLGARIQLAVEQELSTSRADRDLAEELLSFQYRAYRAMPAADRPLRVLSRLEQRARNLAVPLEAGPTA